MPTYLITGAYSGLGLGLVGYYLSQNNNTVIAGVRNPSDPRTKDLNSLHVGQGSTLIIVKIDSESETSAQLAVEELRTKYNIEVIDTAIANAGIATIFPEASAAKPADMMHHYKVNVVGTVLFFQAVLPLLQKSKNPKFVAMGSSAGKITDMETVPFPSSVYGVTKAALNYVVKKIHIENEGIIAFPIDPGFVQTPLGNAGAKILGMEKAWITVDESVTGLVKVIDAATREDTSGRFWDYTGQEWRY